MLAIAELTIAFAKGTVQTFTTSTDLLGKLAGASYDLAGKFMAARLTMDGSYQNLIGLANACII